MAKSASWVMVAAAGLMLAATACPVSTVTSEMVARCCTCLDTQACLEGIDEVMCREDVADHGDSQFNLDCQVENCHVECEFLYW